MGKITTSETKYENNRKINVFIITNTHPLLNQNLQILPSDRLHTVLQVINNVQFQMLQRNNLLKNGKNEIFKKMASNNIEKCTN